MLPITTVYKCCNKLFSGSYESWQLPVPGKFNLLYTVFAGIMLYFVHIFQTLLLLQDTADLNMYIWGVLGQF